MGMKYTPRPYQEEAENAVFDYLARYDSTLVVMATGLGKAQPLSCQILTPGGWMRMGDVSIGDSVIGSDGRWHWITGVFPQGEKPIYRVEFSDGSSTRCCKEHLWSVQTKSQKSRGAGFATVRLEDLMGDLEDGSGANKWFVPVVSPVHFEEREVPVDPYVLGVLLGDGCLKRGLMFSSAEDFIVEEVRARVPGARVVYASQYDYAIQVSERKGEFGRKGSPFRRALKSLGVMGKGAESKFIPNVYLFNSVEVRLNLLRGLMDTDGHVRLDGHAEFSTVSEMLARDVCELVRSLGGCTRVRSKAPGKYTYRGEKRTGRASYRVTVTLNGVNPFLLPRKADLVKLEKNQGQTKAITKIEGIGREACQCIKVSAPDNLYVTDDYILTHNTCLFSHVARNWPTGRVLVLAHREELIDQAAEKIEAVMGERPGVEMGDRAVEEKTARVKRSKVILASVQTLSRENRRRKFDPREFGLIITDEAHHAVASSYRSVYDYFRHGHREDGEQVVAGNPDVKHLGVTATPKRADDLAMGQVFESVAYQYGIAKAVEDGWLVPVRQQVVTVEGLDFSRVRTLAGDFNESDLERILAEESILHKMALPTIDIAGDRPTLIFCVSVHHARLMAEVLNRYKAGSAQFLSGESSKEERRQTVARFKSGELNFLCNCGLFLEGFDAPETAVVVMGRPTKSPTLYEQVLGRGTRPRTGVIDGLDTPESRKAAIAADPKSHMTALDFVGNSGRHKIVNALDVLGGTWGEPVRNRAKSSLEDQDGAVPVEDALAMANDDILLLEEQAELERRRAIRAERAQYRTEEVSPFEVSAAARHEERLPHERPSPKQIDYLIHLGVSRETAERYTKRQASVVIDRLLAQREARSA